MKRSAPLKTIAAITLLSLAVAACGSDSEDSSTEDDDSSTSGTVSSTTSTQTSQSSDYFPTIEYALPGVLSLTGLSLTQDEAEEETAEESAQSSSLLERQAQRGERVVSKLNRILDRLNRDSVTSTGSFSGRGPDGLMSGVVNDLSDDADGFEREAVICHDGAVFMHIKWTLLGDVVEAVRDQSVDPMAQGDGASMLSFARYTRGDDGDELILRSTGTPWHQPRFETDGDMLAEYSVANIGSDGSFAFSAVLDRYESEPEAFEGDEYLVGHLDTEQEGNFVAYNKAAENCADGFDESNTEAPGFCVGHLIGSDERYSAEEAAAAYSELSDIGFQSIDNMAAVVMDETLTCE